jgi:hypothetical protein
LKYKVTVRAKTHESGWRQRTFLQESEKSTEDLRKQVLKEYDMFPFVRVSVSNLQETEMPTQDKPWKGVCCRACWFAKEKRCRCSCKGKNHGSGVSKHLPDYLETEEKAFRTQVMKIVERNRETLEGLRDADRLTPGGSCK